MYSKIYFSVGMYKYTPFLQIFLALCNGAALLTVSRQVKRSPRDLATVLFDRNHSTVLQITPSLFYRFPEEEMKSRLLGGRSRVRILAFGGEKFPPLQLLAKYKTTTVCCDLL